MFPIRFKRARRRITLRSFITRHRLIIRKSLITSIFAIQATRCFYIMDYLNLFIGYFFFKFTRSLERFSFPRVMQAILWNWDAWKSRSCVHRAWNSQVLGRRGLSDGASLSKLRMACWDRCINQNIIRCDLA